MPGVVVFRGIQGAASSLDSLLCVSFKHPTTMLRMVPRPSKGGQKGSWIQAWGRCSAQRPSIPPPCSAWSPALRRADSGASGTALRWGRKTFCPPFEGRGTDWRSQLVVGCLIPSELPPVSAADVLSCKPSVCLLQNMETKKQGPGYTPLPCQ